MTVTLNSMTHLSRALSTDALRTTPTLTSRLPAHSSPQQRFDLRPTIPPARARRDLWTLAFWRHHLSGREVAHWTRPRFRPSLLLRSHARDHEVSALLERTTSKPLHAEPADGIAYRCGRGSQRRRRHRCVADFKSYYHQFELEGEDLGFEFEGLYFSWNVPPFGWSPASGIATTVSSAIPFISPRYFI